MSPHPRVRCLIGLLLACMLNASVAWAREDVQVHAFVSDTCILADEPFFVPSATHADETSPGTAKFFPLLGVVVGQLAALFVNHEIQTAAGQIKSHAARKDTRYAMLKQMNLYRADLVPAPAVSINAKLGCMTIVAGSLQPDPTDCTAQYVPKTVTPETLKPQSDWKTNRTDDSPENQLRRANVCVKGKAHAVYEARFEFSEDGTAYRLKNAGYRIESLLTTQDKGAARTALYTLKISTPSATDEQEVLSVAWVNLGSVTAGARSTGAGADAAPWLRVPPLSAEARRVYEEKTKVHQEVMGEIGALERAMTRNQRMLAGLDQRIAQASGDVADGLRQERTRVAVQYEAESAELEARTAEYQDLPHTALELMPVTIEVAVTETESEKKAQLALADLIGNHSDIVSSAVGSATSELVSKAVGAGDVITDDSPGNGSNDLEHARARYYDAWVQARTADTSEDAQRRLAAAKQDYNAARRTVGLEEIK